MASWTKIQLLQNMQQLPATAKPMMEFATGTYEKFAARRRSGWPWWYGRTWKRTSLNQRSQETIKISRPEGRLYERKDSHVQENSFCHTSRCLCINSYPRPGIGLSWQPEIDEVPLLQLLHNKAPGKVRGVQHPWWCHCRRICAMQAVQSIAQTH